MTSLHHGLLEDPKTGVQCLIQEGEIYNHFSIGSTLIIPKAPAPHKFELDMQLPGGDLDWYQKFKDDPLVSYLLPSPKDPANPKARLLIAEKEWETRKIVGGLLGLQSPTAFPLFKAMWQLTDLKMLERMLPKSNLSTIVFTDVATHSMNEMHDIAKFAYFACCKVLFLGEGMLIPDHQTTEVIRTEVDYLPTDVKAVGVYHLNQLLKGTNHGNNQGRSNRNGDDHSSSRSRILRNR